MLMVIFSDFRRFDDKLINIYFIGLDNKVISEIDPPQICKMFVILCSQKSI